MDDELARERMAATQDLVAAFVRLLETLQPLPPPSPVEKRPHLEPEDSRPDGSIRVWPYLTTPALAEFLGVRPQTLRRWRMTGRGPEYTRLGGCKGRVIYRREDVEVWLSARKFPHTAAEFVAGNQTARKPHPQKPR